MMLDASKLKPINDDVLIRHIPTHTVTNSTIFFKEDINQSELQAFEVVAVGPSVKFLSVGDRVVVSWKRVTEPMRLMYDGKSQQFGITSEKEVDAVIED